MMESDSHGGQVIVQKSWNAPPSRSDARTKGYLTARRAVPTPRNADAIPREIGTPSGLGETPIQWRRNMVELRASTSAGFPYGGSLASGERDSEGRSPKERFVKKPFRKQTMPVVPVTSRPLTMESSDPRRRWQRRAGLESEAGFVSDKEHTRSGTAPYPHSSMHRPPSTARSPGSMCRASMPTTPKEQLLSPATARRPRGVWHQHGIQMPVADVPNKHDNIQKEQHLELEEKLQRDLEMEDDDMTVKLINLPAVMCRASNGEAFMVDTRYIQNKRIRRVLGVEDQQYASRKIRSVLATPKNVGDGTYMDGNMDVGLLPDESEMLNLKVPGEDGNWESVDLNQAFYEEFRSKAPEYVDLQIANFARSQMIGKVDFDHWLMLRAVEKQSAQSVRNPKALRGTSWAPKKFKNELSIDMADLDLSSEEGTPRISNLGPLSVPPLREKDKHPNAPKPKRAVAFGTSVPPDTSQRKGPRTSDSGTDLKSVSVKFQFDGEKMKLKKQPVPEGAHIPSRTKSTVQLRKLQMQASMDNQEECEALDTEDTLQSDNKDDEGQDVELRALVTQLSAASTMSDDFQQRELAKKQYNRIQNWTLAQHQGRGGGRPDALRMDNKKQASRSPSPEKSALPVNRGMQMMKKIHNKIEQQRVNHTILALSANDPLSLVNGARNQAKNYDNVKGRWDKKMMSARKNAIPVEAPPELEDEEIEKLQFDDAKAANNGSNKKNKKKSKAKQDDGDDESSEDEEELERRMMEEHEQRIRDRLRQFEEAEKMVAEHPDYVFTGAEGKPSIKANHLKKVYDAAYEANQFSFDEAEAMEQEDLYRKKAESSRMFQARMLAKPNNLTTELKFKYSIDELHCARPFFRPPELTLLKNKFERRPWTRANNGQEIIKPAWTIEKSIFQRRKAESDAKHFYDTDKLLKAQAEVDWNRVIAKKRFVKFVRFFDAEVSEGGQSVQGELEEVHQVVISNYMAIRSAFYYFCAKGSSIGEAAFSMKINTWMTFCREVGVTDPKSANCNSGALNSMFVSINHEDEDAMTAQEQDENDDNALMRFEWIEGIVRLAVAKFIQDKNMTEDVSDAVQLLVMYHLSTMPPEAILNSNDFRMNRLYNEEMDACLRANIGILEAVFGAYKAKNSSKYFWMEHWITLLEALDIITTPKFRIGIMQAKLIFMWSKMGSIDELRRRQRVVSWQFLDFLEGLGRLADALGLPSNEKLDEIEANKNNRVSFQHTGHLRQWEYVKQSSDSVWKAHLDPCYGLIRQPQQPAESRPLVEKFEAFMGFLIACLCEKWDIEVGKVDKLTSKLKAVAVMLGGGIELS